MFFDLAAFAAGCGIREPQKFAERCEKLRNLLVEVNKEVNLTRITGFDEFNVKHVADSLSLLRTFPDLLTANAAIADIGCGAGFPSLVLAMACPGLQITSIDSTGKKIAFVRQAAEVMQLPNLQAIQGRAVELNRKAEFQRKFAVITARAVAPAPKLYRETTNFPARNGRWIFFKTPGQAAEEMAELQKISGVKWEVTPSFSLPLESGERVFVCGKINK